MMNFNNPYQANQSYRTNNASEEKPVKIMPTKLYDRNADKSVDKSFPLAESSGSDEDTP